jgi:hypothetical protein
MGAGELPVSTTKGAGDRDKLVTIQQIAEVEGGGSFPTGAPTYLAEEWMAREDVPGGEAFSADQTSARFDVEWVMRYRADMDPDLVDVPKARRLVFKGRAHDIIGAVNEPGDAEIRLRTITSSRI